MRIIAQPIDAIAWSNKDGKIKPLRFRFEQGGRSDVVEVERVFKVEHTKRAGEEALVFTCESTIDNMQRLYELRYTLLSCTWVLYKM